MHIDPIALFAALANETRLRCLVLLLAHDELCVCEITHALGVAQPRVSRHLAQLRETRLVRDRREGLWIHYRINPELPHWVLAVLRDAAQGIGGSAPYGDDQAALAAMPDRPGMPRCG
jgi:ArsR family transcriptional regulator